MSTASPALRGTVYSASLIIRGTTYDLSHLDPFTFEVTSNKVPRPLRLNVRFTNHCYSETFNPARHMADEPEIMDGNRRRAFCPSRYSLSHRLAELIRGLADPRAKVHETASRRNWMYSVLVEVPAAGTRYQVFFELRRAPAERRRFQDLEMVVESAYPADPARLEPNILGRVSFLLLCGSMMTNAKRITTR